MMFKKVTGYMKKHLNTLYILTQGSYLFKEGQTVKPGEILVKLNKKDLTSRLAVIQAQYEAALRTYEKMKAGFRKEDIDTFKQLILWADILIDNHPPAFLEAIDLGWDALHQLNPNS